MRHFLHLTALALLLVTVSGCWDYRDINDRTTALAFGVDRSDGKWTLTVGEVSPLSEATPNYRSDFYIGSGPTLGDALDDARAHSARRLYLGAAATAVIGEGVLRSGVGPVFTTLLDRHEVSPTIFLAAAKGTAQALLQTPDPATGSSGVRLERQMTTQEALRDGHIPIMAWEARSRRMDLGHALFLPLFIPLSSGSGLASIGTVVIGPAGREVLRLNRTQTGDLRWLIGVPSRSRLTLPDGTELKVVWNRLRTRVSPGPPPALQMRVDVDAEFDTGQAFRATPERIDRLQREAARVITARLVALEAKLRERGADLSRLGETLEENGLDARQADSMPITLMVRVHLEPKTAVTP